MSKAGEQCEKILGETVAYLGGTKRDGQSQMVQAVVEAFEKGQHLAVQAGTGTGKSLGYLIPSVHYAACQDKKVVVSTATLALQHQIITKDAPLALRAVEEVLGKSPKVAVLKGWQNYVCLHKLNGGYDGLNDGLFTLADLDSQEFWDEQNENTASDFEVTPASKPATYAAQTKRIYQWAHETETGDRDEAPSGISARAWRQVSLSSLECVGESCPYRNECFQVKARSRVAEAQVVVTNHAMLGLVAAGRAAPLPDFDALVVDEAHELAGRVQSQATVELSVKQLLVASKAAARLNLGCAQSLNDQALALRCAFDRMEQQRFTALPSPLAQCRLLLLPELKQGLTELSGSGEDGPKTAVAKAALSGLHDTLEMMMPQKVESGENVLWLSRGLDGHVEPRVCVAPLEVASKLASRIWKDTTAVVTSATLKLGGSFNPILSQIGMNLATPAPRTVDVGSPFQPEKQGILYLASDLPSPSPRGHVREFWDRFVDLVDAAQGGTLGLFTTRAMSEEAGRVLRDRTDWPVLVQGEDSMGSLVAEMRRNHRACLVGTISLWQGVDIPGDSCRLVIIDKTPFPVPTDPLVEARCQAVKQEGGNDFMQVSVTHAALLMAQGAGRLLRTANDRGVVAVLDSRLVRKGYGKFIVSSMPPLWLTTDVETVLGALRRLSHGDTGQV